MVGTAMAEPPHSRYAKTIEGGRNGEFAVVKPIDEIVERKNTTKPNKSVRFDKPETKPIMVTVHNPQIRVKYKPRGPQAGHGVKRDSMPNIANKLLPTLHSSKGP
jgi:hypothetical protein